MGIRIRPGLVSSNRGYYRWAAARGAIRLAEVAGLPVPGSDHGPRTVARRAGGEITYAPRTRTYVVRRTAEGLYVTLDLRHQASSGAT